MKVWPEGSYCHIRGWHFQARLHERYGIVLDPGEFHAIVKTIREGRGLLLRPKVYAVEFRGSIIVVVYDGLGRLVTALALEMTKVHRPPRPKKKRDPRWVGHDVAFGEYGDTGE